MDLFVKYNFDITCKAVLKDQLDKLNISYQINGMGNIYFPNRIQNDKYELLNAALGQYGIDIIDNKKSILAQRVKEVIIRMLHKNGNLPLIKISSYLSEKLGASYRTISQSFTEVCHISIENFIILQRIELAKHFLVSEKLSLTEISYRLHYSSVAHLSHQFKKLTGLTPTAFQKIVRNKRAMFN